MECVGHCSKVRAFGGCALASLRLGNRCKRMQLRHDACKPPIEWYGHACMHACGSMSMLRHTKRGVAACDLHQDGNPPAHLRASRLIAGLVIPWMLSRSTLRWRLAPPFPRPLPEVARQQKRALLDEKGGGRC